MAYSFDFLPAEVINAIFPNSAKRAPDFRCDGSSHMRRKPTDPLVRCNIAETRIELRKILVRPTGFEPVAPRLGI